MPSLEYITEQIVNRVSPKKVSIFGSYAIGAQTEESDVDVFVEIADGQNIFHVKREINRALINRDYPLDLVVETTSLVNKNIENKASFYSMAIEGKSKVYYEQP
jgi:predicted nucleotidyltransferase